MNFIAFYFFSFLIIHCIAGVPVTTADGAILGEQPAHDVTNPANAVTKQANDVTTDRDDVTTGAGDITESSYDVTTEDDVATMTANSLGVTLTTQQVERNSTKSNAEILKAVSELPGFLWNKGRHHFRELWKAAQTGLESAIHGAEEPPLDQEADAKEMEFSKSFLLEEEFMRHIEALLALQCEEHLAKKETAQHCPLLCGRMSMCGKEGLPAISIVDFVTGKMLTATRKTHAMENVLDAESSVGEVTTAEYDFAAPEGEIAEAETQGVPDVDAGDDNAMVEDTDALEQLIPEDDFDDTASDLEEEHQVNRRDTGDEVDADESNEISEDDDEFLDWLSMFI